VAEVVEDSGGVRVSGALCGGKFGTGAETYFSMLATSIISGISKLNP
jgi:hypothetical protein